MEDLNAKWQKYDASREEYVKGLHHRLKEMKAQKEHTKCSHSVPKNSDLLQKEISRLNRLLEEKMSENTKLQKEATEMASARITDRERIQMLEQQVRTPPLPTLVQPSIGPVLNNGHAFFFYLATQLIIKLKTGIF